MKNDNLNYGYRISRCYLADFMIQVFTDNENKAHIFVVDRSSWSEKLVKTFDSIEEADRFIDDVCGELEGFRRTVALLNYFENIKR